MVGFGGVDNVRFRGVVLPGDRLVVIVSDDQEKALLERLLKP